MEGFDATIKACEALGLDLSGIPRGTLQIFYNSGMAFAGGSGGFSAKQAQEWRDSVIWPRVQEPDKVPLPDERPTLPPIIHRKRRGTGRPPGRPKTVVHVNGNGV